MLTFRTGKKNEVAIRVYLESDSTGGSSSTITTRSTTSRCRRQIDRFLLEGDPKGRRCPAGRYRHRSTL